MDNLSRDWLIRTNELADLYEAKEINLDEFSDDQLIYLIYWNWGYSGPSKVNEVKDCEAELIRRNNPYTEDYAIKLIELTEEFY